MKAKHLYYNSLEKFWLFFLQIRGKKKQMKKGHGFYWVGVFGPAQEID